MASEFAPIINILIVIGLGFALLTHFKDDIMSVIEFFKKKKEKKDDEAKLDDYIEKNERGLE